ncbi:glycosyltransferase [Microbacterium resistens]
MTGTDTPDVGGGLPDELTNARRQRDAALARLRHLESSPSYRIGRAATWAPRALRSFLRTLPLRRTSAQPSSALTRTAAAPPAPRVLRDWTPAPRVENPDVSVVIPVYNSAAWLQDCIVSVLSQGGITLEVICIDDGSTDDSGRILRQIADKDRRVEILDQENSGQSVARNRGLERASGRYVIYLDSDDLWQDDALAALVSRADAEELDLLLFDSFAFLDGAVSDATWERYATYYQRSQEYREVRSGFQMLADMRSRRDYRPHVGLYLARTEFVRRAGTRFVPGIVHQDNPYTFSLLLHATRVAHVKSDFYARRIRPGSTITGLDDLRSAKGYFLSYVAMMRELGSAELPPEVSDSVADVVHGVFQGAQKKVAFLSAEDVRTLSALDRAMDAQLVLRALLPGRSR